MVKSIVPAIALIRNVTLFDMVQLVLNCDVVVVVALVLFVFVLVVVLLDVIVLLLLELLVFVDVVVLVIRSGMPPTELWHPNSSHTTRHPPCVAPTISLSHA